MKIIVSSAYVFKYVTEYLNTFDGYISTIYNNIFNYDLSKCEELVIVQWGLWKCFPDYIFELPLKISMINTEQLVYNEHRYNLLKYLTELEDKCGYKVTVYDYSKTNCSIIEENGFIAKYQEYVSTKEENDFLKSLHTDNYEYDIGFIGTQSERRNKILDNLKNLGISILSIDSWGKERDIQLAKCKYIINIHWHNEYKIFEALRCNRWIQAGFKIITEKSLDEYDNENLLIIEYDNMVNFVKNIIDK